MMADTQLGAEFEAWLAREKAEWINKVLSNLLRDLTPQEAAQIRSLLTAPPTAPGSAGPAGIQPVRVPIAAPVEGPPPMGVAGPVPTPSYAPTGTTVGNPATDIPPVAVRTSQFPQVLWYLPTPQAIPTREAGGVPSPGLVIPAPGLVTFTGLIDAAQGDPAVVYWSWDDGEHWGVLARDTAVPVGTVWSLPVPVRARQRIRLAAEPATLWDDAMLIYAAWQSPAAPQAPHDPVPAAIPGSAPYSGLYVPVSAFPQIIAQVAAGTSATANTPIAAPFVVPAPGTIGFFGWIESGSAYFTVAVEQVNGSYAYGALNNGITQAQGAWIGATLEVAAGDTVAFSVSAACTLGSVRATYTPTT